MDPIVDDGELRRILIELLEHGTEEEIAKFGSRLLERKVQMPRKLTMVSRALFQAIVARCESRRTGLNTAFEVSLPEPWEDSPDPDAGEGVRFS